MWLICVGGAGKSCDTQQHVCPFNEKHIVKNLINFLAPLNFTCNLGLPIILTFKNLVRL